MQSTFPRPSQNQLLATLPAADWQALNAVLEWVELPRGTMLYEAGLAPSHAYFPTTAVVSLTTTLRDGASAEVAVVGREGLVGVCAYMGEGLSLSSAVVQGAGQALRMRAGALRDASRASGALMQVLLRYTQALFAQMAQTSACSRHHALDQQLCRWLLLHLDRRDGCEIAVTHESIAQMLGMRREGVTAAALKLQRDGVIRYARGHMVVLDRGGLEARCCECYAVIDGAHERRRQAGPGVLQAACVAA